MIENRATKTTASTLGILVGVAGIEHGLFELLQGNVNPGSVMINAIGPTQRFWEYGTETAFTIIPSFFISGILSILVGLMVTIWAAMFLSRKHSAIVLLFLGILLFLVGGGFAPIFLTLLASATASGINRPLKLWGKLLPDLLRRFLARLWSAVLVVSVVLFVITVEIAIFGYPLLWFFDAGTTLAIQYIGAYIMVGLMLLCSLTGLAYDIQQQAG
jgi:hypothetical protein